MAHSLHESLLQQQQLPSPQSSGAARSLRPTKSRNLTSEGTASSRASVMLSPGGSTEDEDVEHQQQHDIPSDDRDRMRVPSSASPSPMKGPRGVRSSVSPAKSDVRAGAMLALQESVASLLGKRSSPEDEEEGGGVLPAMESVGESESARGAGGKRKRAQRGKGGSRGKAAPVKRRSPVGVREDHGDVGISLSAFEPYGGSGALPQPGDVGVVAEQSLRVVFEDPAQLEERQRLMSLLKTNGNGAAGSKKDLGGVKREGGGSMEEIESGTLSGGVRGVLVRE